MSNRLFSANCPVIHCAPRRLRRSWGIVAWLLVLSALCGWWLSGCAEVRTGASALPSETVPAWLSGAVMGLLFFFVVALVALAVRKVRRDEAFLAALREAEAESDDWLRVMEERGVRLPDDELQRILVACAAEARCIAKHVSRAQTTLSVEDYGDELELASRKLDGVIRCVEALVARMANQEGGAA